MDRIIDIKKRPELYQVNNSPINTALEKYIYSGTKCTMDDRLYNAFRAAAESNGQSNLIFAVIVKIIGILTLISTAIPIVGFAILIIQKSTAMPIYITAMIAMITAVLGVAALKISSGMEKRRRMYDEAIKAVVPRYSECYQYKPRQMLRYVDGDDDAVGYEYYLDLGNFYAELFNPSEKWQHAEYVYAVILNINGRDIFFMFNAED